MRGLRMPWLCGRGIGVARYAGLHLNHLSHGFFLDSRQLCEYPVHEG